MVTQTQIQNGSELIICVNVFVAILNFYSDANTDVKCEQVFTQ